MIIEDIANLAYSGYFFLTINQKEKNEYYKFKEL